MFVLRKAAVKLMVSIVQAWLGDKVRLICSAELPDPKEEAQEKTDEGTPPMNTTPETTHDDPDKDAAKVGFAEETRETSAEDKKMEKKETRIDVGWALQE